MKKFMDLVEEVEALQKQAATSSQALDAELELNEKLRGEVERLKEALEKTKQLSAGEHPEIFNLAWDALKENE